MQDNC